MFVKKNYAWQFKRVTK